ncbi:MAG TPA: class I SAM-dependent methyltransferase [Terriglobia bacterium]|nr:class I SAM-dependent methyltransferase [Terriglobia bacterium]
MPEKTPEYALGHSQDELNRLTTQARLMEPFTRAIFTQAGIAAGMKVLDVGSGPGDVSFLARELVGSEGHVTGIDRSAEALDMASERAVALDYSNVNFIEGDPAEIRFDEPYDALVGRFVLMYYPDPAEALRRLIRHVRPGGIVAFQEVCHSGIRSFPLVPLLERLFELTGKAQELSGAEPQMGLKLYSTFIAAGLPAPTLQVNMGIVGAQDPMAERLPNFLVQSLRSMMPAILKQGLATAEEIDIDTYADRMSLEFRAGGGVFLSPPFIGAWTRKSL